jgi:uncharacterized protein (TIGR02147 family)
MISEPKIFDYTNFRTYFKDLYNHRKSIDKKYSYKRLATDLGFSASSFMHLVITGKRDLSVAAVVTILNHSTWSAQEKKFFQHLIQENQASSTQEATQHRVELDKILGKKRTRISPEEYAYFSKWFIPVLRELVTLKGFVSNLNWISRHLQPSVDEAEVRQGLFILEKLGMIRKEKGRWVQSESDLATDNEVTSELIYKFHQEMLKLSVQSLDIPADQRDISAMTMSLSKKQFTWLKKRIIDFRFELEQELQNMNDIPELVAQVNLQVFPLTKG